jgi:hypothetical protein
MELDERAAGSDAGQILIAETEDLLQHLDRVLAKTGRGRQRPAVVPRDAELVALVRHLAHLGVVERAEEPAVAELRILEVVARALHHAGGDAGGLQAQHELARRVPRRHFGQLAVDQRALRTPSGDGVERGRRRPLWLAERAAQGAPLRVGLDGDGAPLVGAGARIDIVR